MTNDTQGVPTIRPVSGNGERGRNLWALRAEREFRRLLADVMKRSGKSRAQIASEMSRVLNCPAERPVRKDFLDDCVRSRKQGRPVRFPAPWIPAICEVTGSDVLQRHLLSQQLLDWLLIGERVVHAEASLKEAHEATARIIAQARLKAKRVKR
jgi:hypothetical protein